MSGNNYRNNKFNGNNRNNRNGQGGRGFGFNRQGRRNNGSRRFDQRNNQMKQKEQVAPIEYLPRKVEDKETKDAGSFTFVIPIAGDERLKRKMNVFRLGTNEEYLEQMESILSVPEMDECLVHPIMMRLVGIDVDECPKFLSREPSIKNHSIYFPGSELRIQMHLKGIISSIPCRRPSEDELIENDGTLELTPDVDNWDPRSLDLNEQEDAMVTHSGEIKEPRPKNFVISSLLSRSTDPDLFCNDILDLMGIASVRFLNTKETMDPVELARTWNVNERIARRTIARTTRMCPRNTLDISLNRRYTYNDRMLRYKHLPVTMFSDTMFASKRIGKSVRNFTCAQVFATDFGWVEVFLMEYEREVPLAFKSLFREHCVPRKMVMDGARVQVKGDTLNQCRLAGCTVSELERGTPAANRAERAIGVLKTDTKRDMIQAKSPFVLWCFCLERRALVNRSIAKNNFQLNGTTPHSFLTGETTDISNICAFGWYEWIKYRREGPDAA